MNTNQTQAFEQVRREVLDLRHQLGGLAAALDTLAASLAAAEVVGGAARGADTQLRHSNVRGEVPRELQGCVSAPPTSPAAAPTSPVPVPAQVGPRRPPRPARPRRKVSLAEVFAIAGSAVTLIGVALVLMLPQDGVLGPVGRTAIGLTLAVVALVAALWQRRADAENLGAQALMATAIASTFLCLVALTLVFTGPSGAPMLPTVPGLVLAGLVSVGGLLIARAWNSQWLAVLAVLGALLLAPALRETMLDAMWGLAFMVVMTVGTGFLQRGKGWTGLLLARVLPTSVHFVAVTAATLFGPPPGEATVVGVVLAALLAAASLPLAVLHQSGKRSEAVLGATSMVALSAPLLLAAWSADRWLSTVACLAVGVLFTVAGAFRARFGSLVASAAVPLGATLLAFAALIALDGNYQGYLWWGMALAYLAVAERSASKVVASVGGVLAAIGFFAWVEQLPVLVTPNAVDRFAATGVERVVESVLGLAVAVLLLRVHGALHAQWRAAARYGALGGAMLFESAAIVLAGTLIGRAAGDQASGFQVAHGVVTVTWMVLCVVLLALGLRRTEDAHTAVRMAATVAAAAVAKLFLFDLATLPGLARALAFLGVGVLLLAVGTWYYRQLSRARHEAPEEVVPEPVAIP